MEDAVCPICLFQLENPVSTPCGHNFCKDCVTEIRENYKCPLCRSKFRTPLKLIQVNKLLQRIIGPRKLDPLEQEVMAKRMIFENQLKLRKRKFRRILKLILLIAIVFASCLIYKLIKMKAYRHILNANKLEIFKNLLAVAFVIFKIVFENEGQITFTFN